MTDLTIWIIESRHKSPNDFYVKVDGSDYYIGFWVVCAISTQSAQKFIEDTCVELNLGDVELVSVAPFTNHTHTIPREVEEKINLARQTKNREDAQLAAWMSSNGRIW